MPLTLSFLALSYASPFHLTASKKEIVFIIWKL